MGGHPSAISAGIQGFHATSGQSPPDLGLQPPAAANEPPPAKECTLREAKGTSTEYRAQMRAIVDPHDRKKDLPPAKPGAKAGLAEKLASERLRGLRGARDTATHSPAAHKEDAGDSVSHHDVAVAGEGGRTMSHVLHSGQELGLAFREARVVEASVVAGELLEDATPKSATHLKGVSAAGNVIGVVGGTAQVVNGVVEISDGNVVEGGKDVVAGSGYAGAGAAELFVARQVASKVAGPLAGGAAIIDGAYNVGHGLVHEDTEEATVGGFKIAGGVLLGAAPFAAASGIGAPAAACMAVVGAVMIGGAAGYEYFAHHTSTDAGSTH